jgi:hypothetical protein
VIGEDKFSEMKRGITILSIQYIYYCIDSIFGGLTQENTPNHPIGQWENNPFSTVFIRYFLNMAVSLKIIGAFWSIKRGGL